METHKWIRPAGKHRKTRPATFTAAAVPADFSGRTVRAVVALALVAGGLGVEGAATSGHVTGDQASSNHVEATVFRPGSVHEIANPWMA